MSIRARDPVTFAYADEDKPFTKDFYHHYIQSNEYENFISFLADDLEFIDGKVRKIEGEIAVSFITTKRIKTQGFYSFDCVKWQYMRTRESWKLAFYSDNIQVCYLLEGDPLVWRNHPILGRHHSDYIVGVKMLNFTVSIPSFIKAAKT